ncbi:MAG: hypothetical protein CVU51_03515 [Deltaproteobacteria bacterium HGW-Deltaproteobacteria-1]|nr:MAG: hypothetical protein CVU51_03515 [Deltaproteobacteria bacterium HGW-Deltaproteobacteria-1]
MKTDRSANNCPATGMQGRRPDTIKDIQEISNNINCLTLSETSLVFFESVPINLDNDWAINYRYPIY